LHGQIGKAGVSVLADMGPFFYYNKLDFIITGFLYMTRTELSPQVPIEFLPANISFFVILRVTLTPS
jgi:hypothetical protein